MMKKPQTPVERHTQFPAILSKRTPEMLRTSSKAEGEDHWFSSYTKTRPLMLCGTRTARASGKTRD